MKAMNRRNLRNANDETRYKGNAMNEMKPMNGKKLRNENDETR